MYRNVGSLVVIFQTNPTNSQPQDNNIFDHENVRILWMESVILKNLGIWIGTITTIVWLRPLSKISKELALELTHFYMST